MADNLKTAKELALEKVDPSDASESRTIEGLNDAGMEAFLHLLEPELALPKVVVEPQSIKLRLDKGEENTLSLRIANQGRGYLSGTIEVSEDVPGLQLSTHRFGLDSKGEKTNREITVNLQINTENLEAGREYRSFLIINTNGEPESLTVPFSVRAEDRKRRAKEMTGLVLKYGIFLVVAYWLGLLDQIGTIFGFVSPLRAVRAANEQELPLLLLDLLIFLVLLAAICRPPTLLFSGRRPGWFAWFCFAGALTLVFFGLERAVRAGSQETAWAFGTIVLLALIPLFVSLSIIRLLYYRFPHLPAVLSLVITAAVTAFCWGGVQLYDSPFLLVGEDVFPDAFRAENKEKDKEVRSEDTEEDKEVRLALSTQDTRGATYFLVGAEQKVIHIVFTNRCWVRISQDNRRITERTYLPDEEIWLGDAVETKIRLGFPKGAVIKVNGLIINGTLSQMGGPYNLTIIKQG